MFIELLDNEIFTAKDLATNNESLCAVTLHSSTEEVDKVSMIASQENGDYDNIIVKEGGKLIGFIPREQLKTHNGNLSSLQFKKFENYTFDARENIKSIIERIKEDVERSELPNIYLITDRDYQLGIMTYADLNRRSVYIYNYIIVLFIEQWIKANIARNYMTRNRKISNNWMKSLDSKRKKQLIQWSKEKGESTLSVASITDLIQIFTKEPSLSSLRENYREKIPNKTLADIIFIRPKVMHPTKLLVPKNDIKNGLKRLMRISKLTDDLIRQEDFNEKNQSLPTL